MISPPGPNFLIFRENIAYVRARRIGDVIGFTEGKNGRVLH